MKVKSEVKFVFLLFCFFPAVTHQQVSTSRSLSLSLSLFLSLAFSLARPSLALHLCFVFRTTPHFNHHDDTSYYAAPRLPPTMMGTLYEADERERGLAAAVASMVRVLIRSSDVAVVASPTTAKPAEEAPAEVAPAAAAAVAVAAAEAFAAAVAVAL